MEILLDLLTPEGLDALTNSGCQSELLEILTPEEIAAFFNQIGEIDCEAITEFTC